MKNKLIILIFILLFYGCEKHPFDYRNKFIGDYNFSVHKIVWITTGEVTETNYKCSGDISYGSGDDFVKINFLDNTDVIAQLFEDGSLIYYHIKGEFESTKNVCFIIEYRSGGGGTIFNVSGVKTKR